MSLVARGLSVAPPGAPDPVVRGFSLEVREGEWVALGGPNGCGKTSLALALAGLVAPRAGEVTLDGEPIARARGRGAVAAVLQEPVSQLLEPTVAEEMAFTARNLGLPMETIERETLDWARRLGLEAELGRDPRALSAGRQQMVLIAAALLQRPRFLVADEALAHMDRDAKDLVLCELGRAAERGLGILWVTQDPEELAAAGRMVQLGNPPPLATPVPGPPRSPAGIALRIDIAAWDGGPGPRVDCGSPIQVEVPAAGVTALVGRNGSGKSVVLGSVAGLMQAAQVTLTPMAIAPPPVFAGQYPELQMFAERVADEVAFAAVSRGLHREQALSDAARAFDRLGFPGVGFLSRRSFDLSAGEKRLVQVVAALVAPASLILLDEPTSGIDASRRRALAALVSERAGQAAVVVASQDFEWLDWLGAALVPLDRTGR
jgi:energy-coupling factor transport system ATP-binding protein